MSPSLPSVAASSLLALLAAASAIAAAEPTRESLMVSAAHAKPSNPWKDYPTRVVPSLPGYRPACDGELSMYGGIKSSSQPATGFFHAKKIGARWWLIDPTGARFLHVGVVNVKDPKLPGLGGAPWAAQGDRVAARERLQRHGCLV